MSFIHGAWLGFMRTLLKMTNNGIQSLVLLTLLNLGYTFATKCYREKSFGDKAFNIYWCKKPPMTICCTKDEKFDCCEDKSSQHLIQQLQIWGSVFGIVFLIVAIYLYYRVENNICDGSKNLKELCMTCCGCKCLRRKKKTKMSDDYEDIDGTCDKNGSLRNFNIDVISMNRMEEEGCDESRRVSLNLENMSHTGSFMSGRQSIYEKKDTEEQDADGDSSSGSSSDESEDETSEKDVSGEKKDETKETNKSVENEVPEGAIVIGNSEQEGAIVIGNNEQEGTIIIGNNEQEGTFIAQSEHEGTIIAESVC